jgi:deferrochelatase/peroxidase EfeB
MNAKGVAVPSTQADLWCWFRGDDRGELVHQARKIRNIVEPAFQCNSVIDEFMYDIGRDLSGYVDGTENPEGIKPLKPRSRMDWDRNSTDQVSSPCNIGCMTLTV